MFKKIIEKEFIQEIDAIQSEIKDVSELDIDTIDKPEFFISLLKLEKKEMMMTMMKIYKKHLHQMMKMMMTMMIKKAQI